MSGWLIEGETNAAERQCINRRVFSSPQTDGPGNEGGVRATAWSVLIVALTYMAMHMFPVSIG